MPPRANETLLPSVPPPVAVMVSEPAAPRMPPPMPSNPGTRSTEGVLTVLPSRLPHGEFAPDGGRRIDAGDTADGDQGEPRGMLSVVSGDRAAEVEDPFEPRLRLAGLSDEVDADDGTRG